MTKPFADFCGWMEPYQERGAPLEYTCGATRSRLVQCVHCGYCRFDPLPTRQELDHHYQTAYPEASASHYDFEKEYSRPDLPGVAAHLIATVRSHGCDADPLETHDLGCAMGNLVHALGRAGANATGNDLNRDWIAQARRYLGERVSHRPFGEIFQGSSRKLHLVTILHTLEHTPDPLDTLLDVRLRLAPRGIAYICVPNARFLPAEVFGKRADENFLFPTHLHYFTPKSMHCLLRAAGLRILHLQANASHFSPEGKASLLSAAHLAGMRGTEEELVQRLADRFQTGELYVLACRDDSPITTGDPGILARIEASAPWEQPLWRRAEWTVASLGPGAVVHLALEPAVQSVLEWSGYLRGQVEAGRVRLVHPGALANGIGPALLEDLAQPDRWLVYLHHDDARADRLWSLARAARISGKVMMLGLQPVP